MLGSLWDHFGVMLGSLWGHCGITVGSLEIGPGGGLTPFTAAAIPESRLGGLTPPAATAILGLGGVNPPSLLLKRWGGLTPPQG